MRLWHVGTEEPLAVLEGHTGTVRDVALSGNASLVASGSFDGTVRLWDASSGDCLRSMRAERRYGRLDITSLMGITDAQRQALIALGAVDRSANPRDLELGDSGAAPRQQH